MSDHPVYAREPERSEHLATAMSEAATREILERLKSVTSAVVVPNPLREDAEPCENCGAQVIVLTVQHMGMPARPPRLYEVLVKGVLFNEMIEHTPEVCRARRKGRDERRTADQEDPAGQQPAVPR
jgi:hypothetical protein